MRRLIAGVVGAVFMFGGVGEKSVMAGTIVNGSFENGPSFNNDRKTLQAGNTSIIGWEVTGGNIDLIWSVLGWAASDGEYSLDLGGQNNWGGIQQHFSTDPGQQYLVTFDMAGNPHPGPTMKEMQVSAAGESATFSFDTSGRDNSNMGWVTHDWAFTAVDTYTTLEFFSMAPRSGRGPALDNVRVSTVVPEPSTFALLCMSAVGLIFYWRRKA